MGEGIQMFEFELEVAGKFALKGAPIRCEINARGLINTTRVIYTDANVRYILQRINTAVFKKPDEVMQNITAVTEHLREKIALAGGDVTRETLTVIHTKDGKNFYTDENGGAWRMYDFIENALCYDSADSPELFCRVGKAFGIFQCQLADFDASKLFEAIPKFHDTANRFRDFKAALERDAAGRRKLCEEEIAFVLERESTCDFIVKALREGRMPLRVTHNDTKLNNIMIDEATGEGVCVIDLDTVMPGSMLYDYGDAIRFGAASAPEDETDLEKMYLRLDMFEAFTKGFLEGLNGAATEEEILAFPMGVYMLTFELVIRFLTDYLNGDTYFKVKSETHNIERTRAQIALTKDIEKKQGEMDAIVRKYLPK
jgi:hypothetical protein